MKCSRVRVERAERRPLSLARRASLNVSVRRACGAAACDGEAAMTKATGGVRLRASRALVGKRTRLRAARSWTRGRSSGEWRRGPAPWDMPAAWWCRRCRYARPLRRCAAVPPRPRSRCPPCRRHSPRPAAPPPDIAVRGARRAIPPLAAPPARTCRPCRIPRPCVCTDSTRGRTRPQCTHQRRHTRRRWRSRRPRLRTRIRWCPCRSCRWCRRRRPRSRRP